MDMVKVTVLRSVPVSDDGIRLRDLVEGTDDVVRSDQFEDLRAEGYLVAAGEDAPTPQLVTIPSDPQAMVAPVTTTNGESVSTAPVAAIGGVGQPLEPVTIPSDWKNLHHATKKKLARSISGEDPADLAAAEVVIEAYLAEQAPKG
ncbi:hypothetical protein [Ancylobacter radicis]|uniref:Mu-like prophage FluMu N-terminal domain-containing protein n=1 Tax=Ancylobacter radicis TaxID=2836179 RepID=A0ABS5R3J9_9HYPH|nr:hypothetical protein [Ancylobacter radicis]MBS9476233.1 hypothetical protein [Ancylobacter radicis]